MQKLKELFSDTLIYGISSVLARFINYLLVPLHTGVFNTAQYGVIGLVYAAIAFLNVVFTFGMESAYLRYAENRKEAASVFKTLQTGLLIFASLLCLVLYLSMPALMPMLNLGEETSVIFLMMLGILWFDTLSIVPMAELRLTRRAYLFAVLKTLNVLINLALNFYLILSLGWGIEAVFFANLAGSFIMTVLVWMFTADLLKGSFSKKWMSTAFEFGWPFVPSGIGFVVNEMLDRFLLNSMDPANAERLYGVGTTPEDIVGIYNACYKLAVFMLLLVQMYRMAWQPFFMRHAKDGESRELFGQAFIWYNAFSALLFLGVALLKEQIVAIPIPGTEATLIDSAYWGGLEIVPFLLLAYWFHGWYINFSSGVFIKEKTRVFYKITLMGAAITIIANLILIPYFGMTGSAVATLLSYGAMAVTLGVYSKKVMDVPYRLPESFGLMAVMAALVFAEPIVMDLINNGWLLSKALIAIVGTVVIVIYMKALLPSSKTDSL
ncbi:lipopolysaccharide biosynthesis protein [Rhodohalobacter halophilus]|uniref:lipopolysaccharide biosynthesis protein n=1 Tax=Rhodohalobacter halophilus TaxID=1812810 RepID=UPI00083F639B|nr:oligosaccharide flippase family protein [Rhodohalobacter halophilus]